MKIVYQREIFRTVAIIYPFMEQDEELKFLEPEIIVRFTDIDRVTGQIVKIKPRVDINFNYKGGDLPSLLRLQEALAAAMRISIEGMPQIEAHTAASAGAETEAT